MVDCSHAEISQLPEYIPQNTVKLVLANHKISGLLTDSFSGCHLLTQLDLSNGQLRYIQSKAFHSLVSLTQLDLHDNSIDFASDIAVTTDAFEGMTKLKELFIDHNRLSNNSLLRNDLYSHLTNLRLLRIDLPATVSMVKNYTWLRQLMRLEIYGSLKYVSNISFVSFYESNITYLGVHSNQLEDVDTMAFAPFTKLHTLNLSFNKPLGFENVSKAWYGLRDTQVSVLDLTEIAPYDVQLISVQRLFFHRLSVLNISELSANGNRILRVESGLLQALPNVRRLSLATNNLCFVRNLMVEIIKLKRLYYLNVDNQILRTLKKRDLTATVMNEKLQTLNSTVSSGVQLKTKSAFSGEKGYKPTEEIYGEYILGSFPIMLPRCLKELHMAQSFSVKQHEAPMVFILGKTRLLFVNYSGNGFTEWKRPWIFAIPPRKLIIVDLSRNGIYILSKHAFKYACRYFGKLFLSGNYLGQQLANDIYGETFEKCTELLLLDLANNNIRSLPENVFKHQTKLAYLNLSMNSLRSFDISINIMLNLNLLDLSSNLFQYLDLYALQSISHHTRLSIDLSNNPLLCDCQSLEFLYWAWENKNILLNFDHYECIFLEHRVQASGGNNELKNFTYLYDTILPKLAISCRSREWIMYSFFAFLLCILAIIISTVAYRHRWEIKFFFMRFRYRHSNYMQMMLDSEYYEYAAFVSFDVADLDWVENYLKPQIDSPDCRLYLYTEHFGIGESIEMNVQRALEVTRKTILLLSRSSIRSQWCLFEARMAFQKCIDRGIDTIVPILLESIAEEEIPRELRVYLTDYVYLKWPDNSADEQLEFWNKLKIELQINRHHFPLSVERDH